MHLECKLFCIITISPGLFYVSILFPFVSTFSDRVPTVCSGCILALYSALAFAGRQSQCTVTARAILCNPALLLLDEATSALNSVSEAAIQRALQELTVGWTSLMIERRLTTVIDADKIIVMAEGRIVASRSHEDLIAHSDLYRELAERQLG